MRIQLGDRGVGDGLPVLVVAAIDVNHDGCFDRARTLIESAAAAGADAVKFQSYQGAVALGAPIVERHFTDDAAQPGGHHRASREPEASHGLAVEEPVAAPAASDERE